MRIRTRVVLVALAAAALPLASLLWWSLDGLAEASRDQRRQAMERQARLAATAVGERAFADSLADRLGEASGLRVTLIEPDGRVAGDSRVPAEAIPGIESHGDRPEVRAALRGAVGTATRASATVGVRLLYVAVPHRGGVVRVAAPAEETGGIADRAVGMVLVVAAGSGVLLLLAGTPLERFVLRPLRELRKDAERLEAGRGTVGHRSREGEVGALAQALAGLAARLEEAEAARGRERELEALFDQLEEGVALVDGVGVVRRANRAFRRWVGRDEVEGAKFETLFRDPEVSGALESGLGGRSASRETRLGDRTVVVGVRPHGDGAVAVLRDLTRLRRLEGVRRDFVANVSHELKTPLTSVLGFAEPLADPELPTEQRLEFAERILDNGRRMRRLIDDLLDLSRIEAGAWEPERERADVGTAVSAAWRELEPAASEKGVSLTTDLEGAPDVQADRDALRQILRNLLENAIRFAPEGSSVGAEARRDGASVRISVSDRGPGIPEAQRERVFERFYRVDAGRSRAEGGTGLGLSIVQHLVAAHGGDVEIESRVGEGTTVSFTLPAAA